MNKNASKPTAAKTNTTKPATRLEMDRIPAHRAHCKKICEDREKEIMADIDPIHEINSWSVSRCGIGWLKPHGELVEYDIPRDEVMADLCPPGHVEEIALGESVYWLINMEFASKRLGVDCIQAGPGLERWLMAIAAEL